MTSMFREADEQDKDGKTVKGPVSARRVLAFVLSLSAVALFAAAIIFAPQYGWTVFIPGVSCLAGALLLLFFTTWGDVAAIAAAWKGK
jgi:fatty acid desaturase